MNRRAFLQTLGFGLAAVAVAPTLLEPAIKRLLDTKPVRKLKTTWTVEPYPDLNVYHGVELEREITEQMAREFEPTLEERYSKTRINPEYFKIVTIYPK